MPFEPEPGIVRCLGEVVKARRSPSFGLKLARHDLKPQISDRICSRAFDASLRGRLSRSAAGWAKRSPSRW